MKENDPYYLGNRDYPPTQFIFKTANQVFTQEMSWDASSQDLCHAFYTACSSIYDSELVLKTMYMFGNKELLQDSTWQCKSFLVNVPCTLIIRTGYSNTKVQLTDHATGIDLCRAFYTLCLGKTYFSEHIYEMIKDYAEDKIQKPKEEKEEQDE